MRYIGNKTKLLGFIRRVLKARGIRAGTAVDAFSGTASVGRELKRGGFKVIASDVMDYAYVFARAYVQADRADDQVERIRELNALPPADGFFFDNFSVQRQYYLPENGGRIEAIRRRLEEWRVAGEITENTYYVLLAALIEASDRVANTTGVYASFVKTWQPNARRRLEMKPRRLVDRPGSMAIRDDAQHIVTSIEPFDLLYIDPPYNERQYAGYYHIPELLALGWFGEEPQLRGKTGLLPDKHKRTDWSRRKKCVRALERLLEAAPCKHIVMSYNAEGLIKEEHIERLMQQYGTPGTYRKYQRRYRRYRSHTEKTGAVVVENLYCVDKTA